MYFQKVENEWSSKWTVGKIVEIVKSKDGIVRSAHVQYQNAGEDAPRTTFRAARSLIKLFNIDDESWQSDMDKVEKLMNQMEEIKGDKKQVTFVEDKRVVRKKKMQVTEEPKIGEKLSAWLAKKKACKWCCCSSHCSIVEHDPRFCDIQTSGQQVNFQGMLDRSWLDEVMYKESVDVEPVYKDFVLNMISSVNVDLGGATDFSIGDFGGKDF